MKDLFGDVTYPDRPGHVRHSDTSQAAAESLSDMSVASLRGKALALIRHSPDGATCDEVEVALRMRHQTASARLRELFLAGMIRDTGLRRKTRSGRSAVVWRVPDRA